MFFVCHKICGESPEDKGMTYLWGGMILIGVLYGAFAGNLQAVTEAVVSSAGEAVSLCITMAGITAMWTGIMKIAEMPGWCRSLQGRMRPVLNFCSGLEPIPRPVIIFL